MNITNLLLNINFYSEEEYQGESVWPFIGFWIFIAGIVVIVYAVINLITTWREFKIFYDASALLEKPDPELKKKKIIKYSILIVVGILMIVASYLF